MNLIWLICSASLASHSMVCMASKGNNFGIFRTFQELIMVENNQLITLVPKMSAIVNMVRGMDSFSQTQFFRYNKGDKYQTLTGGVVSIALYGIFFYAFIVMVIEMGSDSALDNSTFLSHEKDPSLYNMTANPFMFAVGITQLNLNDQIRYFDITLDSVQIVNGVKKPTSIPLRACNDTQWSGINTEISDTYKNISKNSWLCPPTGLVLPIKGKFSSTVFKYGKIAVRPCTPNSTNFPNTTCATKEEVNKKIADNNGLSLSFYFVNPLLNLGQKDYLDYYLDDSNYYLFDSKVGASANLYFSEYTVTTDSSYLPWSSEKTESGITVNQEGLSQSYDVTSSTQYARIYLRKGGVKSQNVRSYKKIESIFSFIGGLFGLVIAAFFIFGDYSKCAYEIQFGDSLFNNKKGSSYGSENFNFIVYIGYYIYTTLKSFGIALNWHAMKKYEECQEECAEQLDIGLLFKKIELFQHMSHVVFGDYHLCGLHMIPQPTIKDIKSNRLRYGLKKKIYKKLDDKAREIHIESDQYDKEWNKNLVRLKESMRQASYPFDKPNKLNQLKMQTSDHYLRLEQAADRGQLYSKKILSKIHRTHSLKGMIDHLNKQSRPQLQQQSIIDVAVESQNNVAHTFDGYLHPLSSQIILMHKKNSDGN